VAVAPKLRTGSAELEEGVRLGVGVVDGWRAEPTDVEGGEAAVPGAQPGGRRVEDDDVAGQVRVAVKEMSAEGQGMGAGPGHGDRDVG
jgi:hypothetical protein